MRLTSDTSGNPLAQQGHYPFGETWYQGSGNSKWKFTSYERDAESGNDYAMFRTQVSRLGRFSSPDPVAGNIHNPQRLNRYAYSLNDPINLSDSLGLDANGDRLYALEAPISGIARWGFNQFDASAASLGMTGLGLGWEGLWYDSTSGQWGFNLESVQNWGMKPSGKPSDSSTIDPARLAECVQTLFGVTMESFTEAGQHSAGVFTGTGRIVATSVDNPLTPHVDTFSIAATPQSKAEVASICGPSGPGFNTTAGCTLQENYLGTIILGTLTQASRTEFQLYELGNALALVTGQMTYEQGLKVDMTAQSPGQKLLDCARGKTPPRPNS